MGGFLGQTAEEPWAAAFAEDAQDWTAKTGTKLDLAKEWREIVERGQ